jgi:hypothetical protein
MLSAGDYYEKLRGSFDSGIGIVDFAVACLCFPWLARGWIAKAAPEHQSLTRQNIISARKVVSVICRHYEPDAKQALEWIEFITYDLGGRISWGDVRDHARFFMSDPEIGKTLICRMREDPPGWVLDLACSLPGYSSADLLEIVGLTGLTSASAQIIYSRISARESAELFLDYPNLISPAWLHAIHGRELIYELTRGYSGVGVAHILADRGEITPEHFLELVVILNLGTNEKYLSTQAKKLLSRF